MSLTDGARRIGPHPATRTEAEARAEHNQALFLMGVEFGVRQSEQGHNLQIALMHARATPLFEDKS